LTQSDLIFPTQSLNFSSTLHSLKRSALSITNRLASITSDAEFVQSVAEAYGLPLVANERCGSWYIPPSQKAESVYFKSTDGHTNEWSFNLRRLNYQLLDLVGREQGCVVVDSTRRGKSMPDALSKTVTIWCCVFNRAIFADSGAHELHTPPNAVSPSEHAQIEARIDGFVKQFLDVCKPNVAELRQKLQKPLRPLWFTQNDALPDEVPSFTDFHPILLCTASRRVHGGEVSEGGYVQGAADDHEAWAHGLTPPIFWKHKDQLLKTAEEELPGLIATLVKEEKGPDAVPILIKPTESLYISSSQNPELCPFDTIISCTPEPLSTTNSEFVRTKKYLHLPLQAGKLGSRDLRLQLSRLQVSIESLLPQTGKILICCPTGKDLSVGVALAILCLYTNEDGAISRTEREKAADKTFIKQRLTWITTSSPTLNPSRETLKSVNAFLMPDPSASAKAPAALEGLSKLRLVDANGIPVSEGAEESQTHIPVTDHPSPYPHNVLPTSPPPSITRRLFDTLHGGARPWTFTRSLKSKLPTQPSGIVTGSVAFTKYPATTPVPTLLYSEEGEFLMENGMKMLARRKYIYRLQPEDYISVHFFEDEKLFVEMGDLVQMEGHEQGQDVSVATNREQHLCGEDLYTASWRFGPTMFGEGEEKAWWEVRYDVKGPKKDYVSSTRYERAEGKR
jgi:tRNA A64-2'-O-ribosylphosphate transferase